MNISLSTLSFCIFTIVKFSTVRHKNRKWWIKNVSLCHLFYNWSNISTVKFSIVLFAWSISFDAFRSWWPYSIKSYKNVISISIWAFRGFWWFIFFFNFFSNTPNATFGCPGLKFAEIFGLTNLLRQERLIRWKVKTWWSLGKAV